MKRCLLVCPIGIGNYLLAYPTFYLFKKHFPQDEFFLLAPRRAILAFAQRDPLFSGVIAVEPSENKNLKRKLERIQEIRDLQCNTSITFFPSNRFEYNLLPFLIGVPQRYAFQYKLKRLWSMSFLATHKLPVQEGLHDVEQNLRMLEMFEICPKEPFIFPKLFSNDDLKAAIEWLQQKGLDPTQCIGIHAGSSVDHGMTAKRWPPAQFVELCKKFVQQFDTTILIFGGPEENPIKRVIASTVGEKAVSVENLGLCPTAALISQCRLFVSNDSGLMHIASLSGVPTVGIFGPTDDTRTAPRGPKALVVRRPMDCCPCWRIDNVGVRQQCEYGDFRCLRDLAAADVFEQIMEWFQTADLI